MKIGSALIFILFGIFSFLNESDFESKFFRVKNEEVKSVSERSNTVFSDYSIEVDLLLEQRLIDVREKILWRNISEDPADEIYFDLFANAFKNGKTDLTKNTPFPNEAETGFEIENITVGGLPADLIFTGGIRGNKFDSATAVVKLLRRIEPSDSIEILINYSLKIPRSIKNFGGSAGEDFWLFSGWFPRVSVFQNGRWKSYGYQKFGGHNLEFSNFRVTIKSPDGVRIITPGEKIAEKENRGRQEYQFIFENVTDFVWCAAKDVIIDQYLVDPDDRQIPIVLCIQPYRERYKERILEAVEKSVKYFKERLGGFPFERLVVLDVPRSFKTTEMSYPGIIEVSPDLISPLDMGSPEKEIFKQVADQYFRRSIAPNLAEEEWASEGLSNYFATILYDQFYGQMQLYFPLAQYFPIPGIQFLAFKEIPIVYAWGSYSKNLLADQLGEYYKEVTLGSIKTPTYKLPNDRAYRMNTIVKPELMFHSLERLIGRKELLNGIRNYYRSAENSHPEASLLIGSIKAESNKNIDWFFESVYERSNDFDYEISDLRKLDDRRYEVMIERKGSGIFECVVNLYTAADTLQKHWDGRGRWKKIIFETDEEVTAAELDPLRADVFDLNYANNSRTTESWYWASLSISVNWFFWIQNALMILGSMG